MHLSIDTVRTVVRKAFDPESISVVIGKIVGDEKKFRVIIRDEFSKIKEKAVHEFQVLESTTREDLGALIEEAAQKLDLTRGPSNPDAAANPPSTEAPAHAAAASDDTQASTDQAVS